MLSLLWTGALAFATLMIALRCFSICTCFWSSRFDATGSDYRVLPLGPLEGAPVRVPKFGHAPVSNTKVFKVKTKVPVSLRSSFVCVCVCVVLVMVVVVVSASGSDSANDSARHVSSDSDAEGDGNNTSNTARGESDETRITIDINNITEGESALRAEFSQTMLDKSHDPTCNQISSTVQPLHQLNYIPDNSGQPERVVVTIGSTHQDLKHSYQHAPHSAPPQITSPSAIR